MRQLTQAQFTRRSAILKFLDNRLMSSMGPCTADEVREHCARHHAIYVTVDTIQRDLNAMQVVKSVYSIKHPAHPYSFGWLRTGTTCKVCGVGIPGSRDVCGVCV